MRLKKEKLFFDLPLRAQVYVPLLCKRNMGLVRPHPWPLCRTSVYVCPETSFQVFCGRVLRTPATASLTRSARGSSTMYFVKTPSSAIKDIFFSTWLRFQQLQLGDVFIHGCFFWAISLVKTEVCSWKHHETKWRFASTMIAEGKTLKRLKDSERHHSCRLQVLLWGLRLRFSGNWSIWTGVNLSIWLGIATQGIAKRLDKEVLWVPTIPPSNVQEPKQEANYGPTWTNYIWLQNGYSWLLRLMCMK